MIPKRGSTAVCRVIPPATANDLFDWAQSRLDGVGARVPAIGPFPNIAMHVEQPPWIRFLRTDGVGIFFAALSHVSVPTIGTEISVIVAKGEFSCGAGTGSILPFLFRWQIVGVRSIRAADPI